MIYLKDLKMSYGANTVFEHFNLEISDSDRIVSILGHNGAGKTTLLKMIAGSIKPHFGSTDIEVGYKDIFLLSDKGNLYEDMTIRNNLTFLKLLRGEKSLEIDIKKRAENLIIRLALGKHMDKKYSELSSGLKTRANLLAGLIFQPKLLLLDEPTNAIDPMSKKILIEIIKDLEEECQIIIVTHDLEFCYEIADTTLILNEGFIVKKEILNKKEMTLDYFKQRYLMFTEEELYLEGNLV